MRRIIQLPQSGLVQHPLCYVDLEQGTIGILGLAPAKIARLVVFSICVQALDKIIEKKLRPSSA